LQRATLRALLEDHEWNVSRVARVLGVTRMTIYNRLRRLGMERVRVFKTGLARRCADSMIADVGPASGDESTGLPEEALNAPLTGADDGLVEGAQ
jgi:Bacterial regulatory protein, Fis family